MSYKKQLSTLAQMEKETHQAIDDLIEYGQSILFDFWAQAKDHMRMALATEYRNHHKDGWNHAEATRKGTLLRIDRNIGYILDWFQTESLQRLKSIFSRIYKQSALRQSWMLDMVTPPSIKVKIPINRKMMEAVRMGGSLEDYQTRWDAWMMAYRANIYNNLRMNAINEGSITDATDLIDSTKAGYPSTDIGDALNRIYISMAVMNENQAFMDVSDSNEDMVEEEIWQTRYDLRLCDDCEENKGLTPEEADGDIPLHPNCRCYWRVVPKEWADLLRSGTLDDMDLAKTIDASGIMPSSMVIRNEDGDVQGAVIIKFQKWLEDQPMGIRAAA